MRFSFIIFLTLITSKEFEFESGYKLIGRENFRIRQNYVTPGYSFNILSLPNHTYGYQIYDRGKVIIYQTTIPSLPGKTGFKSPRDAQNCAKLVIKKLKAGDFPPSITKKDLRELKIIRN